MSLSLRLRLALIISIGLHMLLIWLVAHFGQNQLNSSSPSSLSKPIRITVVRPSDIHIGRPQNHSALPQPPVKMNKKGDRPLQETQVGDNRNNRKSASIPQQTKTPPNLIYSNHGLADRIKTIATEIARKFAEQDTNEVVKEKTSVSAILDRALNKPREAPGVTSLADGTIRVVTEYGVTYCIKPIEDWRINGPEDDMGGSMHCN